MNSYKKSILKTLIYSSIFDFPLTQEELWQYAISNTPLEKKLFFATLKEIPFVQKKQGLYFLSGKENLVTTRLKREIIAKKKLQIAYKVSAVLSKFFSISFIGIS